MISGLFRMARATVFFDILPNVLTRVLTVSRLPHVVIMLRPVLLNSLDRQSSMSHIGSRNHRIRRGYDDNHDAGHNRSYNLFAQRIF